MLQGLGDDVIIHHGALQGFGTETSFSLLLKTKRMYTMAVTDKTIRNWWNKINGMIGMKCNKDSFITKFVLELFLFVFIYFFLWSSWNEQEQTHVGSGCGTWHTLTWKHFYAADCTKKIMWLIWLWRLKCAPPTPSSNPCVAFLFFHFF